MLYFQVHNIQNENTDRWTFCFEYDHLLKPFHLLLILLKLLLADLSGFRLENTTYTLFNKVFFSYICLLYKTIKQNNWEHSHSIVKLIFFIKM